MVCQNALRPRMIAIKGGVCYGIEVKDMKENENQLEFQVKFEVREECASSREGRMFR